MCIRDRSYIYWFISLFVIVASSFCKSFYISIKVVFALGGRATVVSVKTSIQRMVTSPTSLHGMWTFNRSVSLVMKTPSIPFKFLMRWWTSSTTLILLEFLLNKSKSVVAYVLPRNLPTLYATTGSSLLSRKVISKALLPAVSNLITLDRRIRHWLSTIILQLIISRMCNTYLSSRPTRSLIRILWSKGNCMSSFLRMSIFMVQLVSFGKRHPRNRSK